MVETFDVLIFILHLDIQKLPMFFFIYIKILFNLIWLNY